MRQVLIDRFGFQPDDVSVLQDEKATCAAVLSELQGLAKRSGPEDVIIIYFSGHAFEGKSEPYWVPYDCTRRSLEPALKGLEIHQLLKAIPAAKTIAIVNTHPNNLFLELARRDWSYTLLLAASPGEQALEFKADLGSGSVNHGLFTYALIQALRQGDPLELTPRHIMDLAIEEIGRRGFRTKLDENLGPTEGQESTQSAGHSQTPVLIGQEDEVLFASLPDFPELVRFSRRRNYSALAPEVIAWHERRAGLLVNTIPGFRGSLGRAYLEADRPNEAIRVLESGAKGDGAASVEADSRLALCCAYLAAGKGAESRSIWDELDKSSPPRATPSGQKAWAELGRMVTASEIGRRALLVGINAYIAPEIPNPRGAVDDVDAFADVLRERWGFTEVQVLTDSAANRGAILDAFRGLAQHSRDVPCLFAFSGVGSEDTEGRLTLVAADSRQLPDLNDDIYLDELVRIARESAGNLIAIVDAGWTNADLSAEHESLATGRTAPQNLRPRPTTREIGRQELHRSLEGLDLKLGRMAIYGRSLRFDSTRRSIGFDSTSHRVVPSYVKPFVTESQQPDPETGTEAGKTYGILSHALIHALWKLDRGATVGDWIDAAARELGESPVIVLGTDRGGLLFGPSPTRAIVDALVHIERDSLGELIQRLKLLVQAQDSAETHLNLGLAHAALGGHEEAIKSLERAEDAKDATDGLQAEAHYHLGRILYERGIDLDRAISELQDATEKDPKLTGAFYYLGRALRDSARRNLFELSTAAFQKYLKAGAPLGHRDEVLGWIESSRTAPAVAAAGPVSQSRQEALS